MQLDPPPKSCATVTKIKLFFCAQLFQQHDNPPAVLLPAPLLCSLRSRRPQPLAATEPPSAEDAPTYRHRGRQQGQNESPTTFYDTAKSSEGEKTTVNVPEKLDVDAEPQIPQPQQSKGEVEEDPRAPRPWFYEGTKDAEEAQWQHAREDALLMRRYRRPASV